MFFRRMDLSCDLTRMIDNRYNCTVVKERFQFSDVGKYTCSVASSDSRYPPESKSVFVLAHPGTMSFMLLIISSLLFVWYRYICRSAGT